MVRCSSNCAFMRAFLAPLPLHQQWNQRSINRPACKTGWRLHSAIELVAIEAMAMIFPPTLWRVPAALLLSTVLAAPIHAADLPSLQAALAANTVGWPALTGALVVAMVIALVWMQARHRKRLEESNTALRRSEQEARDALAALRE